MKTYIWKKIKGYFVDFDEEIDSEYWEGEIGETYYDFLDGKWVLLNEEQSNFHQTFPLASVEEVWNTRLIPPHVRTLEDAKREKIQEIEDYDNSNAVNGFSINGHDMWLTVEERQQIATQINANESVGRENMTRWFHGIEFTFPLNTWKQMLVALEVYAGDAINVTEQHKAAVNNLEIIEEVDSYNYQTGYPEKLIFG